MPVFKDSLFEAQWVRAAGYGSSRGAEVGECLAAAAEIREVSGEAWFRAWNSLAERVLANARASQTQGRVVSARDSYLRAANYFRTAYSFLIGEPVDPRLVAAYRSQRSAFEAALPLLPHPAERLEIPYGGAALHGYLFRAAGELSRRPTLIITGGYDSTAEESYFLSGAAAVERGYTCLVFDGPGQGSALIERGQVFRPDWEAVIGPVVDYAVSRPEVDPSKIALLGISFGGYLAARAVMGEPRIAALIADPGEYSLHELMLRRLPPFFARRLSGGDGPALRFLNTLLGRRMRHVTAGWGLRRGLWTHGVKSPLDYLRLTAAYSLQGRVDRIRCPTLICTAENDEIAATAQQLFDVLTCEKAFVAFTSREGAGEHCEAGSRQLFNQRAFDWLDAVLNR
jgi:alpha-beta hydrolase superfamily lysophospholipase